MIITYAAYGSNMNRQQMLARTGGETKAVAIGTALLRDWLLAFRRGVLTVVPQPGALVRPTSKPACKAISISVWKAVVTCSTRRASMP